VKTCVIFNPAARGHKAGRFREHLGSLSAQCSLKPTYAPGAGRALAAEAVQEGFELIVAAGGDGTLNEVVNGMGDVAEGYARACLGVLPLGTINVFARELGMPTSLEAAWAVLRKGREMQIDLAEAEYTSAAGKPERRRFAQMAGAGLDSRAIELVDLEQKKRIGGLAYVVAGCKAMREPKAQIVATDGEQTVAGELILIGNGRFYGGSHALFPRADLRDGLLEVSVFPRAGWGSLVRCGLGLLLKQLYTAGGAKHFQAASVQLYSASEIPFHVDGENAGRLPVRFTVRPKALRVITV
jgi:diacylglycerol kinase (ATP)